MSETGSGAAAPKESETYQAMLAEIDAIVRAVGSPELELDELVRKIERGYGLIKAMRGRLDETKQRIEELRIAFE